MHSSLLISYGGSDVMIDWAWMAGQSPIACHPAAIVLTHAHPDDAWSIEARCTMPGLCNAENVADVERLPS